MSELRAHDAYGAGLNMFSVAKTKSPITADASSKTEYISEGWASDNLHQFGYTRFTEWGKFYYNDIYSILDEKFIKVVDRDILDKHEKKLITWHDWNVIVTGDSSVEWNNDWFNDVLSGKDQIYGNKYSDSLLGGDGADVLRGNGGKDRLYGENGDDRLYGGNGNDALTGGRGTDFLKGGYGKDVFIIRNISHSAVGADRDQIPDFTHGLDTIDLGSIDANSTQRGNQTFAFIGQEKYSDTAGGTALQEQCSLRGCRWRRAFGFPDRTHRRLRPAQFGLHSLGVARMDVDTPDTLSPPLQALWWLREGGFQAGPEWERAHEICQSAEGVPEFDRVHALAHWIEGDAANSAYWYRRAGATAEADIERDWARQVADLGG